MKQTIDSAAHIWERENGYKLWNKSQGESKPHSYIMAEAFKAGAEHALKWNKVEECLPEIRVRRPFHVLVKSIRHSYTCMDILEITSKEDIDTLKKIATHWRYIEFK